MDFKKIKNLVNSLREKNNFLLLTHKNFDFDAISSLLSLAIILDYLKKDYFIYLDEEIKDEFLSLPKANEISNKIEKNIENIIFLDCERKKRVSEKVLEKIENKYSLFIDHHQTNILEGNENYVFIEAISTTHIIYYLKEEIGLKDKNLSDLIMLGILGDTNFLKIEKESVVYKEVFKIILNLLEEGSDYYSLIERFYFKNWKFFRHYIELLSQIEKLDEIGYIILKEENNDEMQSGFLVNKLLEIKEIKIAFVLKKIENNRTKISLRSKGDIDVSLLVKLYFNGGGHKNAASGYLEMDLNSSLNFVLEKIKEYLKK